MKKQSLLKLAVLGLAFVLGLGLPVISPYADGGGILVMPIRVVFKDRDRTANITLVNTGAEDTTFRISIQWQKQKEDGGYDILKAPFDTASDLAPMLVYSPRQVMLPAGEKQRIRLSLRRPPDLADGEYRTHLLMTNMSGGSGSNKKVPAGKLALDLGMNVGYSIPIVLRQGSYDTTASISDPKFVPAVGQGATPQLMITLNRTGKFSTIGKVLVFVAGGTEEEQVGLANNVNIFPELTKRTIAVNLTKPLTGGTIRVVYEGDGPDKGTTFDQKTYPIGN